MGMVVFPIKLYLQTLKFEWHMLCVLKCFSSFDFFQQLKIEKVKNSLQVVKPKTKTWMRMNLTLRPVIWLTPDVKFIGGKGGIEWASVEG